MAVTPTKPTNIKSSYNVNGTKKERVWDCAFSGSYATGGEAITARSFGLTEIHRVTGLVTEAAGQTTAWQPLWDATNGKLKLFGAGTGATGLTEHAAAAYATATAGRLTFIGV